MDPSVADVLCVQTSTRVRRRSAGSLGVGWTFGVRPPDVITRVGRQQHVALPEIVALPPADLRQPCGDFGKRRLSVVGLR